MADNDKDKIKEILEGHSKKFSTVEIIVGIVVVLLIGSGIGYAIFKLLSPPSNTTSVEYQMQTPESVQSNPIKETPSEPIESTQENEEIKQENNGITGNETLATQEPTTVNKATPTTAKEETEKQTQPANGPQIVNLENQIQTVQKKEQPTQTEKEKPKAKQTVTQKPKKEIKHHTVKPKPKTHKKYAAAKKYIIWVSSNKNRKFALTTVLKLRKCGHNAFIKEVEVKGKTYTRVYVGPVNGYYAAKIKAREIKKQLKLSYMPIIKKYDKIP